MCNIKINYSQEDFQMKKLLLNLLVVMSNDPAVAQVRHTVQVFLRISVNAVQSLNMTTNRRSIKRSVLFWLCWPSWSPLEPCLSGRPWHVTGPQVSKRLSSCRRWWLLPTSLHSCWTTTWAVKETHACCSCWTGVSNKVKEPRDQKKMLHCNWHVKGQCLCIKHRIDWHILHTLKVLWCSSLQKDIKPGQHMCCFNPVHLHIKGNYVSQRPSIVLLRVAEIIRKYVC